MLSIRALRSVERVDRGLLIGSLAVFTASAAGTAAWCRSMSGGMSMPGGWTMSMAWMRMPGDGWLATVGGFLGMWAVMMVAMMLPSLVPALARYRCSVTGGGGWRTLLVAAGYFSVWVALGAAILPLGVALALAEMRWEGVARAVPFAAGTLLVLAGWVQLTPWKARVLGECRNAPRCEAVSPRARSAWRHGVRLGVVCALCCAGFTTTLLVLGVMDLRVMALLAAAITLERLAPWPVRLARVWGGLGIGAGLLVLGGLVRLA